MSSRRYGALIIYNKLLQFVERKEAFLFGRKFVSGVNDKAIHGNGSNNKVSLVVTLDVRMHLIRSIGIEYENSW